MANQWFKFYGGEYLSDPKIERLSPIERSCWVTLLCLASMNGQGVIEFLTIETLLNKAGIQFDPYHPEEWEKALSVLTKFQNLKMVNLSKSGDISIVNWEKRQEHNLTIAERVAKSRLKKKSVTTNVTNVTTEENRIEENRLIKDAPLKSDIEELLEDKGGIQYDYQFVGLEVFEKTGAPASKKAECIRLAKKYPNLINLSLSFCLDYPNPAVKWKMFLWKLNKLVKENA